MERNAGIITLCGDEDRRLRFCGLHTLLTTHFLPPLPPTLALSYLAVRSNWPHRAQISLFRPAEACGRNAQAVGLINLWDSNVRAQISAPLLHNDFTPTQIPHRTTLRTGANKLYFMTFYVKRVSLHYCFVCMRES